VPCVTMLRQIDHIKPVKDSGEFWNLENLQPFCGRCHKRKTRREAYAYEKKTEWELFRDELTELFKLHHSLVMEGTRGEGVEYRRLNI